MKTATYGVMTNSTDNSKQDWDARQKFATVLEPLQEHLVG
jgi:hypothetical protein